MQFGIPFVPPGGAGVGFGAGCSVELGLAFGSLSSSIEPLSAPHRAPGVGNQSPNSCLSVPHKPKPPKAPFCGAHSL